MNPVLTRELKERMRGLKSFIAVMIFLGLLIVTLWLVYEGNRSGGRFDVDLERQTRIGRELFEWVLSIVLLLVCFFVPGLTAGAIAGERERQTLLPLQITLLRPRQILWGKVMAALAFLVLLVVAALPIFAIAYQLGGVDLLDIGRGILAVVIVGILLSAMVVGISAFARRVQTATLLAYGFTFVLLVGSFVVTAGAAIIDSSNGDDRTDPPAILAVPNPLVFAADFTAGRTVDVGSSPLRGIRELVTGLYDDRNGWIGSSTPEIAIGGNDVFVEFQDPSAVRRGFPAWAIALITMGGLALLLFTLGCRRVRTPSEVER